MSLSYEKLPEGVLRCELRLRRLDPLEPEAQAHGPPLSMISGGASKGQTIFALCFDKKHSARQISSAAELLESIWSTPYPEHIRCRMQKLVTLTHKADSVDAAFEKMAGKQGGAQGSAPSIPAPGRKSDSSPQELFH